MKGKNIVISVVLVAVIMLLGAYWFSINNSGVSKAYAGYGRYCNKSQSGWCWKAETPYCAGGVGGNGCILEGVCSNLPSLCCLIYHSDELGLNDEQVAKLKHLKNKNRKNKARLFSDFQLLELDLQELLDKKPADENAVDAKLDAIAGVSTQIAKDCLKAKLAARKLLSDSQLEKWKRIDKPCANCPRVSSRENTSGNRRGNRWCRKFD